MLDKKWQKDYDRIIRKKRRQDNKGVKMKSLVFFHRGIKYRVSLEKETMGHVMEYGDHSFTLPNESWRILGVSFHHWRKSIDKSISCLKNAQDFNNGLIWDIDHGTVRQWGGQYGGKLPRVTGAIIENERI